MKYCFFIFFCAVFLNGQTSEVKYLGSEKPHHHLFQISGVYLGQNKEEDVIVFDLNWLVKEELNKKWNNQKHQIHSIIKKPIKLSSFKVFFKGKEIGWEYQNIAGTSIEVPCRLSTSDSLFYQYELELSEYERNFCGGVLGAYVQIADLLLSIDHEVVKEVLFQGEKYKGDEMIPYRGLESWRSMQWDSGSFKVEFLTNKQKLLDKVEGIDIEGYLKTFQPPNTPLDIKIFAHKLNLSTPAKEGLGYYAFFKKEVGVIHLSHAEMLKLAIAEHYFAQQYPSDTLLAQAMAFDHFRENTHEKRLLANWERQSNFFWIKNDWNKQDLHWNGLNDEQQFLLRPLLGDVYGLDSSLVVNGTPFSRLNEEQSVAPIIAGLRSQSKVPLWSYGTGYKIKQGWVYDDSLKRDKVHFLSLYEHAPILPTLSFNDYDGFGLHLTASADNLVMGRNQLSYFLSPGYGFKSKAFIYEAFARLRSYGFKGRIKLWQNAIRSRKHYQFQNDQEHAWYNVYQGYSDVIWRLDVRSKWRLHHGVTLGWVNEGEQLLVETSFSNNLQNFARERWNWETRHIVVYKNGLHTWDIGLRYLGLLQGEEQLHHLEFNSHYKYLYTKDAKGVELGMKFGAFVLNEMFNSRFYYNFSGRGSADYNYSQSYLGRNEADGFLGAQINPENWFKSRSERSVNGNWYGLVRLGLDLPKGIPLQWYHVIGFAPVTVVNGNTGSIEQRVGNLYEMGISIIFAKGAIKMHLPLYNFNSLSTGTKGGEFFDSVSFELNLFQLIKKDTRIRY